MAETLARKKAKRKVLRFQFDCLHAGPNLLAKIFDILLRFRLNYIGILADIKQAFLNLKIFAKHQKILKIFMGSYK